MEDRKEQINKITEIIEDYSDIRQSYYDGEWQLADVYSGLAKTLYNKGIRVVDNGSIILTREKYEKVVKYLKEYKDKLSNFPNEVNALVNMYNKGSKETAEKIITKIKQFLGGVETIRGDDENKLQPEIGYKCSEVDDFLDKLEKEEVNL